LQPVTAGNLNCELGTRAQAKRKAAAHNALVSA
jgi:hypothetical protein